ncbi:MAG: hypothetical protein EOM19_03805 [Candidatus Moranbacteria bacterium]|nr:hypothetical protein [Candidatus Moranbacteria bacterium]
MKLVVILSLFTALLSGCSITPPLPSFEMGEENREEKKELSLPLREIGEEDMEFLWKGFSKQLDGVELFQEQVEMFQCLQIDVSACDELGIKMGGGYIFGTCLGIYTVSWDDSLREKGAAHQCMKTISVLKEVKEE